MFREMLTLQEQIIFDILIMQSQAHSCELSILAQKHDTSVCKIYHQINAWIKQPLNTRWQTYFKLSKSAIHLDCSASRRLDLLAHLFQHNQACQLLNAITEQPFATMGQLAKTLYLSPSTIKRRLQQLTCSLSPYQMSLSLRVDPILKGCEFRIRWLSFVLSLLFDPPFNWFCRNEIYHRFEEIQLKRVNEGKSLNLLPPEHLSFNEQFSFQLTEKGWTYLTRQLFAFDEGYFPLTQLPFLHFEEEVQAFFHVYQEKIFSLSPIPFSPHLVAEE